MGVILVGLYPAYFEPQVAAIKSIFPAIERMSDRLRARINMRLRS